MTKEEFFQLLTEEVKSYKSFLETDSQDWIVKGFYRHRQECLYNNQRHKGCFKNY